MKFLLAISLSAAMALGSNENKEPASPHTISSPERPVKKGKWQKLFDGKSLKGWHAYNKGDAEIKNWIIIDGALVCLGASAGTAGDLVTDKQYADFELEWDWKVDKGSNSGVMYHVVEDKRFKAASQTGPEYQIIDDIGYPAKLEEWQKTGADYAMYTAASDKKLKPVGEWNRSKIVFNKGKVEHWLNGQKIVAFEAWSEDWNKRRMAGKWADYPDYGKAKTGAIVLQDHGNKAYFRNIRIREL